MPNRLYSLVALAAVSFGPALAGSCKPPSVADPHIRVDANSMKLDGGNLSYANLTDVRVLFIGKNPYKYDYKFVFTSTVLESAPVQDLLTRLAIPLAPPVAAPGVPANGVTTQTVAGCEGIMKAFQALQEKVAALKKLIEEKRKQAAQINQFIDLVSNDGLGNCEATVAEAASVKKAIDAWPEGWPEIEAAIAQAEKDHAALVKLIEAAAATTSPCPMGADYAAMQKDLAKIADDAKVLSSAEAKATQKALRTRIVAAETSDNAFWELMVLPKPDEPTVYDVTGAKQAMFPKGDTMKTMAQVVQVRIGRSRFSLSGGVGITSLGTQTIGRVPSKTDPTKQVFGYTENSSFRPALVVLGTGHLYQSAKNDLSLGISLGALVTSGSGSGATAEYVMGPSLGFLRNLLILTGGIHVGRREQLNSLAIGDAVPGTATDPLPVQKNWKAGAMFAITYRFK